MIIQMFIVKLIINERLKVMTYNLINGNDFNVNEQIDTKYLIVGSGEAQ